MGYTKASVLNLKFRHGGLDFVFVSRSKFYLTVVQNAKMTILQSISTFLIIGLLGFFQNLSTESSDRQNTDTTKMLHELQGTWIHSKDNLATVKISESMWTFIYEGEATPTGLYNIDIIDSLPKYVTPENNSIFLILTNPTDTLEYEIFGLNDTILSLMYFPRGNMHVYKRDNR